MPANDPSILRKIEPIYKVPNGRVGVADGKFDANELAFASVKLWKDLNQDGISQTGELFSFAQLGVQGSDITIDPQTTPKTIAGCAYWTGISGCFDIQYGTSMYYGEFRWVA